MLRAYLPPGQGYKRRDGIAIHCISAIRGVFDRADRLHVDGILSEEEKPTTFWEIINTAMDIIVLLDKRGKLLHINPAGGHLLGLARGDLIGRSIFDFVLPLYRELFSIFLSVVQQTGREEGILTILDSTGIQRELEFLAVFVPPPKGLPSVQVMARDVTSRNNAQRQKLNQEKFSGILEMAGGVAHKLNQPLTVMGHLVQEVMSHLDPLDVNFQRMRKIRHQLIRLNEIAKKIGSIRKYEAMDYVAGVRIVDIDRASKSLPAVKSYE